MIMKYFTLFLMIIFSNALYSQNDLRVSNSDLQFGIATKLNLEFDYKLCPAFKLSITGGVAYDYGKDVSFNPSLHMGILLFNNGSIGANQSKKWYKIQPHFYSGIQLTTKLDKKDFSFLDRNVPLYHFAEFSANPLQNPYKSSISYGVNWILLHNKKIQRVGFFNLNFSSRVQLTYYNDGGPVLKWVGDKRDRYYTGGLIISYHGNNNSNFNLVELSYHKFTGYQEHAFDVADKLQIDYLNFKDTSQFTYNQQRWRINISNLNNGFGGSVSLYNCNRLDLQDFLHFTTNVPYHPDYYQGYRWMFGGRYEYNYTNIPK